MCSALIIQALRYSTVSDGRLLDFRLFEEGDEDTELTEAARGLLPTPPTVSWVSSIVIVVFIVSFDVEKCDDSKWGSCLFCVTMEFASSSVRKVGVGWKLATSIEVAVRPVSKKRWVTLVSENETHSRHAQTKTTRFDWRKNVMAVSSDQNIEQSSDMPI
jgi:hypothetical protein